MPAYAAAEGDIVLLTISLANEWGSKGIFVSAGAPDYVETDMNTDLRRDEVRMKELMQRMPTEDERVVFLASSASADVTREVLVVTEAGWAGGKNRMDILGHGCTGKVSPTGETGGGSGLR